MDPRKVGAFAIHVLTASGAALALIALILATGGHWTMMFACLGLALIVDGVDGPLARALRVKDVLPRWDGAGLDFVVDFTTYVFVPAYAIAASGLLPDGLGVPAAALIVITGALYFADRSMKTDDNYFRGFPAVWNVIAFYLYVLMPPPRIAARRHSSAPKVSTSSAFLMVSVLASSRRDIGPMMPDECTKCVSVPNVSVSAKTRSISASRPMSPLMATARAPKASMSLTTSAAALALLL